MILMCSTLKLLGITIQHEKPQLEVQKTELLRKEEELKVQLAELEESLLEVRDMHYNQDNISRCQRGMLRQTRPSTF